MTSLVLIPALADALRALAYNVPPFSVLLAMTAAVATPFLPQRDRIPERVACVVLAVIGALSAYLLLALVHPSMQPLMRELMEGGFALSMAGRLRAGPLEALLALTFAVSMLSSILGNAGATAEDVPPQRRAQLCVLMNLLMCSLLALTYANDLFLAYVFVEISTVAACAIVAAKEEGETLRAALRYLVMSLVGSGLILLSVALLYALTGHLLMEPMGAAVKELIQSGRYALPLIAALYLTTLGLAIKSALYPFGFWLSDTGCATPVVGAVLAGLVLKGHIFLFIKIFYRVFGMEAIRLLRMDDGLLLLGVLSMIAGSLHALKQRDVKRMISWSSVAQMGYILLGVGLNSTAGVAAGCLHIIVHATDKPMLSTAAGGLVRASGHSQGLHDLRGAFYRNRWAGFGLMVGACSMMGIPGFAGFASKLNLMLAAFDTPYVAWALAALAASAVLNALYYVPAVIVILTPSEDHYSPVPSSPLYRGTMAAFVALNFFLGLFCVPLLRLIEYGVALLG